MSNLVFLTGDFNSGSTLLFTLFRQSGEFYCLYEPLHEDLLVHLTWRRRPYKHHFFVGDYFTEYEGFRELPRVHRSEWGVRRLYLPAAAQADDLYRYLSYVTGTAFGRSPRVLLKENRFTFRMEWIRSKFPQAKVVNIWRDRDEQWNSIIARSRAYYGKDDVGQSGTDFNGAQLATWCNDLQDTFPSLRAEESRSGYERFCKLWELSRAENQRHADISVNYRELVQDFEVAFAPIRECVGMEADLRRLKRFVVPPDRQEPLSARQALPDRLAILVDRAGAKQARLRLWLGRLYRAR